MSTDNVLYRLVEKRPLKNAEIDSNFRILVEEIERLNRLMKEIKGVVWSDSPPADRSTPWLNKGDMRIYYWNPTDSLWISKHHIPANDLRRFIWTGTEADIKTLDGGEDVSTTTNIAGPFWEVDDLFQGRVAVGAGKPKDASGAEIPNAHDWVSGTTGKNAVDAVPWHRHGYAFIDTGGALMLHSIVDDGHVNVTWNTATKIMDVDTSTGLKTGGMGYQKVTGISFPPVEKPTSAQGDAWTTEPVYTNLDKDLREKDTNTVEQPGVGCFVLKRSQRVYHVVTP